MRPEPLLLGQYYRRESPRTRQYDHSTVKGRHLSKASIWWALIRICPLFQIKHTLRASCVQAAVIVMPRITAELITESPQFTNPVKDWELDLRGNKIAVIENLGATLDQFDTIDFSDNEIRKVDGFPMLHRLKHILMNNNRVCRVAEGLEEALPQLETLVLTNNNVEELTDIEPLTSVKTLTYLSLLRNPVVHKPSYRLYVIHKLPQLRVLDFKRIRQKERQRAEQVFGGKKGEERVKVISKKAKTFNPGEIPRLTPPKPAGPSPEEMAKIREAIANAKSLEEVQQLEAMLKAGQIPGKLVPNSTNWSGQVVEEDEMEAG